MAAGEKRDLALRLTRKYVGTYQHEDEWRTIGEVKILSEGVDTSNADEDMCEPWTQFYCLEVKTHELQDNKTIARALSDIFTKWGCAHEHDCCGCRSYMVRHAVPCGDNEWMVTVHSSRNY